MLKISTFIKRHAVLTYYALVFAISWGGLLILIGPGGVRNSLSWPVVRNSSYWFVVLVTLVGPPVAGVLSAVLVHGKTGLRDLTSRLVRWRVDARWYAVALLTAPLTVFATLFVLSSFSPAFLPSILTTDNKASLLLPALVAALVVSFCEELGWTGFAIPEVSKRYNVLGTGLFVGILWAVWHVLSNLWGTGTLAGSLPLPLFLIPFFFSWLPPYRVLMVWVYDHTRSLFVAMIMHGSLDFFWLISMPTAIAGVNMVTWYIAWAALLWVVVAVALRLQTLPRPEVGVPPARISNQKGASS